MRRTRAMTENGKEHSEDVARNRKRGRTNKETTSLTVGEYQNSNITSMSKGYQKKEALKGAELAQPYKTYIQAKSHDSICESAVFSNANRPLSNTASTPVDSPGRVTEPPKNLAATKSNQAGTPAMGKKALRSVARAPPVVSRQIQADTMEVSRILSPASVPPSYRSSYYQLASHQANVVARRHPQRHPKGSLNKLKEQKNNSTRNKAPVAPMPPRQSRISPLHQPLPVIPIQAPKAIVQVQSPQTLLTQFNKALLKTASNSSKIPVRVLPPYVSGYVQAQTSGTMKSISARNPQPTMTQAEEPQTGGASLTRAANEVTRIPTPELEPEIAQIRYSNIDEYRRLLVLYHRVKQPIKANDNVEAVEEAIAQAEISEIDDNNKLRAIWTLENYKREIQPIQEGADIEVVEQRIRVVNLVNMPHRALKTLFNLLDPVSSACTGLAAKRLYTYHIEAHGYTSLCTPLSSSQFTLASEDQR